MNEPPHNPDPVKTETEERIRTAYPNGHFYSPVVDTANVLARKETIWPAQAPQLPGINFNDRVHRKVLSKWFPRHMPAYDYPEHSTECSNAKQFYTRNTQFSWLDARTLFVFLNELKPRRMIEIGSGWSSLLTADVNHRFLNNTCRFQCIEPYPREFLLDGVQGMSELITEQVQQIPMDVFESLQKGDILFIDSSHVCKTDSDVNHLYFEVLPRLRPGVLIHVHDIFLPCEYPEEWVIGENRSWNEQYLLRALLMYSRAFQVFFACKYASVKFPELVAQALALPPGGGFGGGSFWIRKR